MSVDGSLITMAVDELKSKIGTSIGVFTATEENKNQAIGEYFGNNILPFGIGKSIGGAIGKKVDNKKRGERVTKRMLAQRFGAEDEYVPQMFAEGGLVSGGGTGDQFKIAVNDDDRTMAAKDQFTTRVFKDNAPSMYGAGFRPMSGKDKSLYYADNSDLFTLPDKRRLVFRQNKESKFDLMKMDKDGNFEHFDSKDNAEFRNMDPDKVVNYISGLHTKRHAQLQGTSATAVKMEEGGAPPKAPTAVEHGELLSDLNGTIIERYDNPNRFSKHGENPYLEPMGNFVDIPEDAVVVPKKLAKRFDKGDTLTRRSILRQLIDNQVQDPEINNYGKDESVEKFGEGGISGSNGKVSKAGMGQLSGLADKDMLAGTGGDFTKNLIGALTNLNTGVSTDAADGNMTETDRALADLQGGVSTDAADGNMTETDRALADLQGGVSATGGTKSKRKQPVAMYGRILSSLLPGMAQAVNAMESDPYLEPVYNNGFNKARGTLGKMITDVNVDDMIGEVDNTAAAGMESIQNANSPSARAEVSNIVTGAAQQKSKIKAEALRQRIGYKNTLLQSLAGIDLQEGSSDQGESIRYQNEQRMDKATRENILAGAMDQNYRMLAGTQNDMEKIKVLNSMSQFEDVHPMDQQLFQEDPEAREYIFTMISSGMSLNQAIAEYKNAKTKTTQTVVNSTKKDRYGNPAGSSQSQIKTIRE